jgi:nitroreductase
MLLGAQHVVDNLHRAPVIIVVCGTPENPRPELTYSAVYAASQNMLVAARAMGLGAAFTTFHVFAEPEVREILQIPDDRFIGVTMPLGWPARPFGPVTRRPIEDVIHRDVW